MEKAVQLYRAGLFAVGISLDSANQEDHDKLRGRPGAFKEALRAIGVARDAGLYPYVIGVATHAFLEEGHFYKYLDLVAKTGALEIHLLEPCPVGKLSGCDDVVLSESEKAKIIAYQHEIAQREDMPRGASSGSLSGVVVVLDAGHGGKDGGTSYTKEEPRAIEKTITLDVALRARKALEARGAAVVMTRAVDEWVSLYRRIAVTAGEALRRHAGHLDAARSSSWPDAVECRRLQDLLAPLVGINSDVPSSGGLGFMRGPGASADHRTVLDVERQHADLVFVSLHVNAHPKLSTPNGLQVFWTGNDIVYREERTSLQSDTSHPTYRYYDDAGRQRMAEALYAGIAGRVPGLASGTVVKTAQQNFAVLRETNLVGALVEMGYVTNPKDRGILMSADERERIAQGVAEGIAAYFAADGEGAP